MAPSKMFRMLYEQEVRQNDKVIPLKSISKRDSESQISQSHNRQHAITNSQKLLQNNDRPAVDNKISDRLAFAILPYNPAPVSGNGPASICISWPIQHYWIRGRRDALSTQGNAYGKDKMQCQCVGLSVFPSPAW